MGPAMAAARRLLRIACERCPTASSAWRARHRSRGFKRLDDADDRTRRHRRATTRLLTSDGGVDPDGPRPRRGVLVDRMPALLPTAPALADDSEQELDA